MLKSIARLLLVLWGVVALGLLAGSALAQSEPAPDGATSEIPETLTVGVFHSPPFVVAANGEFSGMAIDLWEMMAKQLGRDFTYRQFDTVGDLVKATEAGTIDVAVTNLSITRARAERIDFTHPWFDAGLRLMVSEDGDNGFWDVVAGLGESGHLRAYAWIIGVIIAATILITLFDRRFDKNFPRKWADGLAESFYVVMSVTTSGRPPARKNLFGWLGRVWQALWLVCGVATVAYVTSSVTSVMTTLSLNNSITSVSDLYGRRVGVSAGSVSEEFARAEGFDVVTFSNIDASVAALNSDRVAGVIDDAPVLEYYAHTHPEASVDVIGAIFEPDKYGFGLPRRSPLTRLLTVELIGAQESGALEALDKSYFGEEL